MPYQRPSLDDLRQQARQDILNGGIPGVTALLRYSVLNVLATVMAGLSWLHYQYLDWIARQAVPWTATDEYLEAWGTFKKTFRKPATVATGQVSFPVTGSPVIPEGTTVQISGGGTAVTTAESVTTDGVTVAPCAITQAGAAGNIAKGATATLGSPQEGVQTTGRVTEPFTGGADAETDDALRDRILAAFERGGENGNREDYEGWAKAVPGVTRAWVNPLGFGAGSVVLYIMLDNANAANAGFPIGKDGAASEEKRYPAAAGDQLTVANALYSLRSVTALVIVCSPERQTVDFTIDSLGTNNTAANQALIAQALQDMFTRLSAPGATLFPNQWNEAVAALGLSQFNISSPSAPIIATHIGAMPMLGSVSFRS
ncbi:baseplate J/gp47 family protein [Asaia astilbis]